ncbi:MAG: phosphoribosyltransferase family protein [Ginsengibacter sp.]
MPDANIILTAAAAAKKMQRMAYEIVEQNIDEKQLLLAGIKESGLIIAHKIKSYLEKIFKGEIMVIAITLDKKDPKKIAIAGDIDFNDKVIIIIDDVANTGKTLLYALKPFLDYYPRKMQTLALVDRSHKEFPVYPDFVGMSISTGKDEKVIVETQHGEVLNAWLKTIP